MGQDKQICNLLKGISNERPPLPRYCSTWDVDDVLTGIKGWGHNKDISIKGLTLKLSFLLAITSMHRGTELKHLKTHLINKFDQHVVFQLDTKLKNSKQGKTLPYSEFHKFKGDQNLCPVTCLEDYLQITGPWRITDNTNTEPKQLFLSHIKPHVEVSTLTICRWIKETLSLTGVDIFTYKAHSTRAASAAKGYAMGLSIDEIITKGNWSGTSTFTKFYHKPIMSSQKKFQETILKT